MYIHIYIYIHAYIRTHIHCLITHVHIDYIYIYVYILPLAYEPRAATSRRPWQKAEGMGHALWGGEGESMAAQQRQCGALRQR